MKVAIMPLLDIGNYGSVLQAFASVKKLEEYADVVELINCLHGFRIDDLIKSTRNPAKILVRALNLLYVRRNFREIEHEHLSLTSRKYHTERDFSSFPLDADLYCTGSDQIWNNDYAFNLLESRYLSFVPKGKLKFAYASSFGKYQIDDDIVEKTKEYIHQFKKISVREDSGVKILNERYGYENAIQLVDPTLALPAEFWRKNAPIQKIRDEYILIYSLENSKVINEYAKSLSKRKGLPIYRICTGLSQIRFCGKSLIIPPYFEFITLIDNAKYVLTDSFHGAAFAMNLNTELICVNHLNPGRISSLLRLVGQEHRAIKDFQDFDILNRPTDFAHVNRVLATERKRVDEFLSNIFITKEPN